MSMNIIDETSADFPLALGVFLEMPDKNPRRNDNGFGSCLVLVLAVSPASYLLPLLCIDFFSVIYCPLVRVVPF